MLNGRELSISYEEKYMTRQISTICLQEAETIPFILLPTLLRGLLRLSYPWLGLEMNYGNYYD